MLCLIVLLVLAARSLWGEADHPYWPLRWGCAVAAGTAALHGLVDVPLHRVQLGWWVLSVSGLALQSFRSGKAGPSRVQRAFFIAVGTGALTLGGTLVRAQCFAGKELPPFMVAETEKEVLTRFNRHDIEGATNLARETLKVYPMNASLYLQVGFLLLQFQNTDAEADEVFKAQRLLEPNLSSVPLQQGEIWITIDTDRTAALWLDALARRHRSDRAVGLFQDDGLGFYSDLLRRAASVPAVERKLVSEAIRSPAYAFAWLDNASAPIDPTDWNVLIASADLLKRFSEEERSRFLLIWYAKSDRSALARFLSAHPEWETASRPLRLRQLADSGQFEAAVRQAAGWYSISLELPALNPATVPVAVAEDADPARAFTQYWKEGNTISAHRVLAEAANVVTPKTAEFYKIETALAAHDARWPEAWVYIQKAVTTEHPETRF